MTLGCNGSTTDLGIEDCHLTEHLAFFDIGPRYFTVMNPRTARYDEIHGRSGLAAGDNGFVTGNA